MKIGILKILIGLILFSFIGIKYEPEFVEPAFFLKPKPSLTIEYKSPIYGSDLSLEELKGPRRQQELDYREFVGSYYNNPVSDGIAFFLVPIMMFLLITGLMQVLGNEVNWRRRARFLIGIIGCLFFLVLAFLFYWNLGYNGYIMTALFMLMCILALLYLSNRFNLKPQ